MTGERRSRHPNDPEVVAHQLQRSSETLTPAERALLLEWVDREIAAIDARKRLEAR